MRYLPAILLRCILVLAIVTGSPRGIFAHVIFTEFILNTSGNASPINFTVLGGRLLFSAMPTGLANYEPMTGDGTIPGTHAITALPSNGAAVSAYTLMNGKAYFAVTDLLHGTELWVTDGSAAGTMLVKDICNGAAGSNCTEMATTGSRLLFTASTPATGYDLWVSDGTDAGTQCLDIFPGGASSDATGFVSCNGKVYFVANEPVYGRELWVTDGTKAGTHVVRDINTASTGNADPHHQQVVNGKLYFTADDGVNGRQLWMTDGTAAGTAIVALNAIPGLAITVPLQLAPYNGRLYFAATRPAEGTELWATDGTVSGTQLVADIQPGADSATPEQFTVYNGKLYFRAVTKTAGAELWVTDGTAAATHIVKDLAPGVKTTNPRGLTVYGNRLYFIADDATYGGQVYRTDGSEAGTVWVSDPAGGFNVPGTSQQVFYHYGGALYLAAANNAHGRQLWSLYDTAFLDIQGRGAYTNTFRLQIYPNPNKGNFTIELPSFNAHDNAMLAVYDITGRVVHSQRISGAVSSVQLADMPRGVYEVRVTQGSDVAVQKLVVDP